MRNNVNVVDFLCIASFLFNLSSRGDLHSYSTGVQLGSASFKPKFDKHAKKLRKTLKQIDISYLPPSEGNTSFTSRVPLGKTNSLCPRNCDGLMTRPAGSIHFRVGTGSPFTEQWTYTLLPAHMEVKQLRRTFNNTFSDTNYPN